MVKSSNEKDTEKGKREDHMDKQSETITNRLGPWRIS